MVVRSVTVVSKGRDSSELLTEFVLVGVEEGTLLADVGHLIGLQWRHLLLHCDGNLLGVVPLLWKFLQPHKIRKKI